MSIPAASIHDADRTSSKGGLPEELTLSSPIGTGAKSSQSDPMLAFESGMGLASTLKRNDYFLAALNILDSLSKDFDGAENLSTIQLERAEILTALAKYKEAQLILSECLAFRQRYGITANFQSQLFLTC